MIDKEKKKQTYADNREKQFVVYMMTYFQINYICNHQNVAHLNNCTNLFFMLSNGNILMREMHKHVTQ